jgi:hypothetical protein
MYFAHSLLEREDPAQEVWARAAYRDGDWGKRWSLAIPAGDPPDLQDRKLGGLAALAVPNFYPEQQTTGLPVYDVGMVWARALWDIREMLKKTQEAGKITTDGRDVADRLALESYLYVHGWNSSFEMAAEGLIDAAQKLLPEYGANEQHKMKIKGLISDRFAARGILAERGVQAIAQVAGLATEQWVIGTDFGLRFTSDLTQPWQTWTELRFSNEALPGVVGVTRDGNTVYIATESGVYSWDSQTGGQVTALTNPSAALPPPDKAEQEEMLSEGLLSVEVIGGDLYVGTQRSVWRRRGNVWQNLGTFGVPILGITGITPPASGSNPVPICLIRTPNRLQWRVAQPTAVQPPPSWRVLSITGDDEKTLPWITAIQVVGNNTLYVATSQQGVRPIQNLQYVLAGSESLRSVLAAAIPTNQLDKRRILCLAAASATQMFAGTTDGLFECNPASNTGWLPVPGSPPGVITVLTRVATTLVAGTTSHGLLLRQETAPGTHVVTPVAMDT